MDSFQQGPSAGGRACYNCTFKIIMQIRQQIGSFGNDQDHESHLDGFYLFRANITLATTIGF